MSKQGREENTEEGTATGKGSENLEKILSAHRSAARQASLQYIGTKSWQQQLPVEQL